MKSRREKMNVMAAKVLVFLSLNRGGWGGG